MRKEKGITLIALVVTIVVLLILAGVSISMLTGENGIVTQASKANEETTIAREQEQVDLAVVAIRGNDAYTGNNTLNATNLKAELEKMAGEGSVEVTGDKSLKVTFLETQNTYQVKVEEISLSKNAQVGDYVNYGKDLGIFVDEYGDISDNGGSEPKWRICYINDESGVVKITTSSNIGIGEELLDTTVATGIRKISLEEMNYLENIGAINILEETETYKIFQTTSISDFLYTNSILGYATNEGGAIGYYSAGKLKLIFNGANPSIERPVITLKTGITYTDGDGTYSNPYNIY